MSPTRKYAEKLAGDNHGCRDRTPQRSPLGGGNKRADIGRVLGLLRGVTDWTKGKTPKIAKESGRGVLKKKGRKEKKKGALCLDGRVPVVPRRKETARDPQREAKKKTEKKKNGGVKRPRRQT